MNTLHPFHDQNSRGVALILILSMVVLLTALVILVLTRASLTREISYSSAGQQKADQMAQGGLQQILDDLRQEIAAGSVASASNTAGYSSQNVYIPSSNQTSVPAFSGYTASSGNDPQPNLLKFSAYGATFFPNSTPYNVSSYPPSSFASNLNTGISSSIDGRSISSTRWNKPVLLSGTFSSPDWVMVTGAGPQPFAAWSDTMKDPANTQNYVIGRYAYMIYDEGGLLDANTAGCATSLTGDFDKFSKRGRLGQADLTALPGLTQADIDKLVLWRNATTANGANPAQAYFDYLFHGSFATGNFQYNTVAPVDPSAAFMTVANGDQTFLSRQDLLDFFKFTFATQDGSPPTQDEALPYLGTFSPELNQPSYCPPNPNATAGNTISGSGVPSQYMYANNASQVGSINRNFPSVKFLNGGLLPDGVTTVQPGDPLVRRRFPLSRLQLLQNKVANPNDTSNDALIKDYFGLIYDSSTGKWTYTSPDAGTVASSIKTLDQVAQVNPPREPDFFELLQAGILNGSLGKTAGVDLNGNSTSGSETVAYDSRTDFQVIQIGANIIDQYGADPSPTTITYGGTASGTESSDFYDFYGIENLPYISKINQVLYRKHVPAGENDPTTNLGDPYPDPTAPKPWYWPNVSAWFQFELWNPHQNPEAATALPLRIYAVGTAGVIVFVGNSKNGGTGFNLWVGNPNPAQQAVAEGLKTFTSSETITVPAAAYAQADYFREPKTLTASLGAQVSDPADHLQEGPSDNPYCGPSGWDFIGLKTGDAFAPDLSAEFPGDYYVNYANPVTGWAMNPTMGGVTASAGGITFYLQCEYPPESGNWKTIQRIKNCIVAPDTGTVLPSSWLKCLAGDSSWLVPSQSLTTVQAKNSDTSSPGTPNSAKSAYRMLPDPRTDRFGVFEGYREDPTTNSSELVGPSFNETFLPSVLGNTTRGLFGYPWDNGRMRTPTTWSYLSFYPWARQYANNGWVDEFFSALQQWQNIPNGKWAGLLNINSKNIKPAISSGVSNYPFTNYYYADNDGIIRGGDGYYADGTSVDSSNFTVGYSGQMGPAGTDRPERPLIINRPFRSVGELGYVHRGEPWKSLDFFTPDSADAGLLDLFSIDDEDIVAGTVDLNTRQAPVIQAILQGAIKNELATSASASGDPVLSSGDASALANALVQERLGTVSSIGPLQNRSELVTRFLAQNTTSTNYTAFPLNKTRREAVVRPLAAVGNTRTWNLLIDIIAQSGRYPSAASIHSLGQFEIQGEKRYWWHVAIDRYTGQIVDSQLEPVYE